MITEPFLLVFRAGAWWIVVLRMLRLMLFLVGFGMVWDYLGLPSLHTQTSCLVYSAVGSLVLTLIPRRIKLSDDLVAMWRFWFWIENSVAPNAKPILLARRISEDLTHVVLIFPNGPVNLLRIVPLWDLIVRESDMETLHNWADPPSEIANIDQPKPESSPG